MIPFLLTIVGGYLIGDSMKDSKTFANGGMMADGGGVGMKKYTAFGYYSNYSLPITPTEEYFEKSVMANSKEEAEDKITDELIKENEGLKAADIYVESVFMSFRDLYPNGFADGGMMAEGGVIGSDGKTLNVGDLVTVSSKRNKQYRVKEINGKENVKVVYNDGSDYVTTASDLKKFVWVSDRMADGGEVTEIKIKDIPNLSIYENEPTMDGFIFNPVINASFKLPPPNDNLSQPVGGVEKEKKNSFTAFKYIGNLDDGNLVSLDKEKIGTFKTINDAKEALLNAYADKNILYNNQTKPVDSSKIIIIQPRYSNPIWKEMTYQEKVDAHMKALSKAGVEIGDIVTTEVERGDGKKMGLYGTITLFPESENPRAPILVVYDNMTRKALGIKDDRIDGFRLYLKSKDIAQITKKKKIADGGIMADGSRIKGSNSKLIESL